MYSSFNNLFDHSALSSCSPVGEPMALGSPPLGSPPRGHTSSNVPYLPGYLLGDTSFPASGSPSSRLWPLQSATSPTKGHHNTSNLNLSPTRQALSPIPNSSSSSFNRGYQQRAVPEKHGGPPVSGLFDGGVASSPSLNLSTIGASTPLGPSSVLRTSHIHKSVAGLQAERMTPARSPLTFNKSPPSPNQLDPFYTQGQSLTADDVLDETWVTVFGFPPSAASYIIQQFSQYGNIIEHKLSSCGNWMHIHYQSKLQAKKALSKNGKVFSGSMMIGVNHCIEKSVMLGNMKENASSSYLSSDSLNLDSSRDANTSRNVNFSTSMRALTQSYRAAASEHEVVPTGSMPQKSGNLMTKAMEYVFGW